VYMRYGLGKVALSLMVIKAAGIFAMGCGLNKLEKHDEKRPGNIYSTLKRPQVETKIDIFYEYHFLEFTTLSNAFFPSYIIKKLYYTEQRPQFIQNSLRKKRITAESLLIAELPGSSAIRLSSLHDLPSQLQEWYQQGFMLAAVHPFVQPTNENEKTPQAQIFRAVLIKKTERSLKSDAISEGNTLEIESCFSSDHLPDKSEMPDLIKKCCPVELFHVVRGLIYSGQEKEAVASLAALCDDFAQHFREKVVNASLREGRVPTPLKEVVIQPILKKASLNPEVAVNFRLVANIPFLGKVLEQVVAGQLQTLLDEMDYLDPFSLRPGYSTESALVTLYNDLCRERDGECIPVGEAVAVLNQCLAKVMCWMRANKLSLNPDKREVRLVGRSLFQVSDFDLVLDGVALPLKDRVCSLGVLLDPELSLESQVVAVTRSTFRQLRLIHRPRPYLDKHCLAVVIHALVTSWLDYCNVLYVGLPLKMVRMLQLVQNRAARLLYVNVNFYFALGGANVRLIQDAASRGLRFVGIVPQHVSQMSFKSSSAAISTSNSSRELKGDKNPSDLPEDSVSLDREKADCTNEYKVPATGEENVDQNVDPSEDPGGEGQVTEHLSLSSIGENGGQHQETEIFAVFNKAKTSHRSSQYYTVTIPVKIISNGQSICSLEANWLEHMTEHFRKGSTLVNAIFSLGMGMTDGIFIFEDLSVEDSKSIQGYDAIVVEQWTVLEFWHVPQGFCGEKSHQLGPYISMLSSVGPLGTLATQGNPSPMRLLNRINLQSPYKCSCVFTSYCATVRDQQYLGA
ncbi:Raftlin, partial [Varanus komodoensis]